MSNPVTIDEADSAVVWRRATFCTASGCVEVAMTEDGIAVRDSRGASSPVLRYDRAEWEAFIAGVKAGEFDLV